MKRDIRLIQIILEKAANTGWSDFPFPDHQEYDPIVVEEHVRLCEEDGLIRAKHLQGGGGFIQITSKSHDCLDALDSIRDSEPKGEIGFRKGR